MTDAERAIRERDYAAAEAAGYRGQEGVFVQGMRAERAAVVAYLRRLGDHGLRDIAERIERGEHRP